MKMSRKNKMNSLMMALVLALGTGSTQAMPADGYIAQILAEASVSSVKKVIEKQNVVDGQGRVVGLQVNN